MIQTTKTRPGGNAVQPDLREGKWGGNGGQPDPRDFPLAIRQITSCHICFFSDNSAQSRWKRCPEILCLGAKVFSHKPNRITRAQGFKALQNEIANPSIAGAKRLLQEFHGPM
jgi:hypothetical protein